MTSPDLAIDALAYEYTSRIIKSSSPEEHKKYCNNVRHALAMFVVPPKADSS